MKEVKIFRLNTHNPDIEKTADKDKKIAKPKDISIERDIKEGLPTQVENDPDMRDFYTTYDPYKVTTLDKKDYDAWASSLGEKEKEILSKQQLYYQVTVENKGGLIMPLIFQLEFKDGTKREVRIPAEIWKRSEPEVTKVFSAGSEVVSITLDPWLETADVDVSNNYWPPRVVPTTIRALQRKQRSTQRKSNATR